MFQFFDLDSGFAGVADLPDGLKSKEAFIVLQEESIPRMNPASYA